MRASGAQMLVCWSCCEWYHAWCAEEAAGGGGWTCARCVACAACARPAARLRCRACAGHYHAACLPAPPPDHRSDWPQVPHQSIFRLQPKSKSIIIRKKLKGIKQKTVINAAIQTLQYRLLLTLRCLLIVA